MNYPNPGFTSEEQQILKHFFTNTDQPVFAITNLPEVVKGAMFARYSRYPGDLRRMFLEEFYDQIGQETFSNVGEEDFQKAANLYERVFVGYGDDSIAQVGGAHIACEYCSNILTKIIQRGRLAAYLEQSTRYIAYDQPLNTGQFRFYDNDRLGDEYTAAMTKIFELYRDSIPPLQAIMADKYPREDNQPEGAWKASVRAKTLDLLRGMLPSAALSHVGMYASGQAYENMLLRMLGHPLPEARDYGQRILDELKIVIPSFVSRVERADRGGKRIKYQNDRREAITNLVKKFGLDSYQVEAEPNSVELVYSRGSENDILSAGLFELSDCSQTEINKIVETLPEQDKISLVHAIVGDRENRRHRPGRCFESVSYRFEIVSDYGAFRDLQRHRMLTCQWQALTPELGAEVPEELPQDIAYNYQKALEVSSDAYYRLVEKGFDSEAPYTLCLGYKMRYVLELNAREAMQLIELRSGVEGHPSYRAVAQEMHRLISQKHPMIGQAMQQVDLTQEPRLERLLSEIRTHNKQKANNK